MTWLTLWFALQVGMVPNSLVVTYNPPAAELHQETFYTELQAEARILGVFYAGGMVRTEVQQLKASLGFRPELSSYGFSVVARWEGLEIGYRHVCQHPTVPYWSAWQPVINWDGAYEELFVRLSGEVGGGR